VAVDICWSHQRPDAQLRFQQVVSQFQQQSAVNAVMHQLLSVLAKANAFQPFTHISHCMATAVVQQKPVAQC
jgi:hypothetical protein